MMALMHKKSPRRMCAHGGNPMDCPKCMDDGGQVQSSGGPQLDPTKAKTMSDQFNKPNTSADIWSSIKKGFSSSYAKGGEVGVHKASDDEFTREESKKYPHAAQAARQSVAGRAVDNEDMGKAKDEHKKVLGEMRMMPAPNLKGLAEGGEAEDAPDMQMDDDDKEIHESLGKELMEAIHGGDHIKIMDGLEACVLRCMNKRG